MTIFEHWQNQKELLRPKLAEQPDLAGVVYQVRHAIMQTEQNALAELEEDMLRQQAGVMLGMLKTSIGLMETNIAAQVWVPQKQSDKPKESSRLQWIAAGLLVLLMVYCGLQNLWLGSALAMCCLILSAVSLFSCPKVLPSTDEVRVTLKPDVDRLFIILDGQIRSIDRAVNDFSYLNDQMRSGSDGADPSSIARAADLLEAIYSCDEELREEAEEAAMRLLASIGLYAVPYSEETSRYFNALPSKNTTRTLSPAILSLQDRRLLRRGTAAVCTGAA